VIFQNPKKLQVILRMGNTDMRKSWNGLVAIIQYELRLDPYDRKLFLFMGKSRKLIKALYWDGNGFCLLQKRLAEGQFPWPKGDENFREMSQRRLYYFLRGIDFRKEHQVLIFPKK